MYVTFTTIQYKSYIKQKPLFFNLHFCFGQTYDLENETRSAKQTPIKALMQNLKDLV